MGVSIRVLEVEGGASWMAERVLQQPPTPNPSPRGGGGSGGGGLPHQGDEVAGVFEGVFEGVEAADEEGGDAQVPVVEHGFADLGGGADQGGGVALGAGEGGELGPQALVDYLALGGFGEQ